MRPINRSPISGAVKDNLPGCAVSDPGVEGNEMLPTGLAAESSSAEASGTVVHHASESKDHQVVSVPGQAGAETLKPFSELSTCASDELNGTGEDILFRTDRITFGPDVRFRGRRQSNYAEGHSENQTLVSRVLSMQGVGARSPMSVHRLTTQPSWISSIDGPSDFPHAVTDDRRSAYFPGNAVVSRNSNFNHLTEQDRLRLGGTEYRAVVFLSWVVPIYFVVWQLLGCLSLGAYINRYYAQTCLDNGLNPW